MRGCATAPRRARLQWTGVQLTTRTAPTSARLASESRVSRRMKRLAVCRRGIEVVRAAVARRDLDVAQLAVDAHFLDGLGLAADDRDLRLEIGVAARCPGRRRRRGMRPAAAARAAAAARRRALVTRVARRARQPWTQARRRYAMASERCRSSRIVRMDSLILARARARASATSHPAFGDRHGALCSRDRVSTSQVEHFLALLARRLEAAALVELEDGLDDGLGLVDDLHEVRCRRRRSCLRRRACPRIQARSPRQKSPPTRMIGMRRLLPVCTSVRHFAKLVERAEAAGQDDVRRREAHEHHLAREEIAEVDARRPGTALPLCSKRQQDVEADRGRACPRARPRSPLA